MVQGEHAAAAFSEYSSYINSEGVLANEPELMVLAKDGHPCRIPDYQFWNLRGEGSAATHAGLRCFSQYVHIGGRHHYVNECMDDSWLNEINARMDPAARAEEDEVEDHQEHQTGR